MSTATIGQRVEDMYCDGFANDLPDAERAEIIEYAASFEECSYTHDQLVAMTDAALVDAAYSAMCDYARGQV